MAMGSDRGTCSHRSHYGGVGDMFEHRWAQFVALFTFCMLVIGGNVNVQGASLACPEASFVCHGQLFPPMVGGVLYEHGHRQWGQVLGILQIVLTVSLLLRRHDMKRLAWLTLGMVCVQGALGALTVYTLLPWYVSTAHLLFGMAYFATLLQVVYLTRPATLPLGDEQSLHRARRATLGTGRRWIQLALGVLIAQLALGALVRHFEATLVCLDMPSCQGSVWWPAGFEQQIHMIHRGFGVVTALVTWYATARLWQRSAGWPALRSFVVAAPLVAIAQVTLGVLTVLTLRGTPAALGHFAGAMLLWSAWIGAWIVTGSGARALPSQRERSVGVVQQGVIP